MKRSIALFLCAVLLLALAMPTYAATNVSVKLVPETATVQRGQEIKIKVEVTSSGPVESVGVILNFDKNVFELTGGKNACGEIYADVKDKNGDPVLAVYDLDEEKGGLAVSFRTAQTLNKVEIGYITLKVKANAALGAVSCTAQTAAQADGAAAATSCTAASVTVTCAHSWGNWTKTDDSKHSRSCSLCPETESADHILDDGMDSAGKLKRTCATCGYEKITDVPAADNRLVLTGDLAKETTVYIEGLPYTVRSEGTTRYVILPSNADTTLVTYTFHEGDGQDVHTQYPIGMKVYKVSDGKATHIPELDNLLQYSGSSIRITGKKGIRMITSIEKDKKTALTGKGLAGYTLEEYGTVLSFAHEIGEDDGLVLGRSFARSNYAYKKDVADPVFASTNTLAQYTNVLVGFSLDQCKEDIAMRPYIILKDARGQTITLYGGTIYRSIGYIAYQNRSAFAPKTGSYNYVWEIIHHVYGDKYDAEFKG